jgi:hypothetical protein
MNENENQTLLKKESVPKLTAEEARELLWRDAEVSWLLHSGQHSLYKSYFDCKEKIVVWNCARRFGKSYTLCVLALETCLKTPFSIVKYCCAKQTDARGIIRPLIREIISTCPKELRPVYKTMDKAYVFPNGSKIEIWGLDGGRAEGIRGGSSHLAIVDEAGLVGDLKYIIKSIILPTTTTTKGKIILASTPPKTPGHSFIVDFLNRARIQGNLVTKTVFDNPHIDASELDKIIEESGGIDSIDFKREYLCHILIDTEYAIIPEFTEEVKLKTVKEWPKPPFFDGYVAMDVGMKDLTVVLFAYFDFRNDKVVIEDEFVINGQKFNTKTLAEGIKQKEDEHFTHKISGEFRPPYLRISDNNLILIKDLWDLHGIRFIPTRKDDADAALNVVRNYIQDEKVIINPKCKTLIHHLETGVWNKSKTSFERSSADKGHFDAIDSLKYLIRNIRFNKNPFPKHFGELSRENVWDKPYTEQKHDNAINVLKSIFNFKK